MRKMLGGTWKRSWHVHMLWQRREGGIKCHTERIKSVIISCSKHNFFWDLLNPGEVDDGYWWDTSCLSLTASSQNSGLRKPLCCVITKADESEIHMPVCISIESWYFNLHWSQSKFSMKKPQNFINDLFWSQTVFVYIHIHRERGGQDSQLKTELKTEKLYVWEKNAWKICQ